MKTIAVLCILLVLGLVANASPARSKSMDFKRKSINEFWDKFNLKDEDRMIDIGKMSKFL